MFESNSNSANIILFVAISSCPMPVITSKLNGSSEAYYFIGHFFYYSNILVHFFDISITLSVIGPVYVCVLC